MNNYIDSDLVLLIEETAQARGDVEIPREFIEEALRMVNSGLKKVPFYPNGTPSLKAVYNVAAELMRAPELLRALEELKKDPSLPINQIGTPEGGLIAEKCKYCGGSILSGYIIGIITERCSRCGKDHRR